MAVASIPTSVTTAPDQVSASFEDPEPAVDAPKHAHTVSDPLGIQNDGETGMDAEDDCIPGMPPSIALDPGDKAWGMLIPLFDQRDHYRIAAAGGTIIQLEMSPAPYLPEESPVPNFDLQLLSPMCVVLQTSDNAGHANESITYDVPLSESGNYVARVYIGPVFGEIDSVRGPSARSNDATIGPLASTYLCHPPCGEVGYLLHRLNGT